MLRKVIETQAAAEDPQILHFHVPLSHAPLNVLVRPGEIRALCDDTADTLFVVSWPPLAPARSYTALVAFSMWLQATALSV